MLIQADALKLCSKCQKALPLEEFYPTKQNKSGYRSQCISCHRTYQRDPEKRAEWSRRHYEKRKQADPALFMWKQAKHRAQYDYDGMEFTIAPSDIKIPERCPYLNTIFIPLDKNYGYSLDRIDSQKGYTPENIQVVSRLANIMKNNATTAQLIRFAEGVLRVHSEKE